MKKHISSEFLNQFLIVNPQNALANMDTFKGSRKLLKNNMVSASLASALS